MNTGNTAFMMICTALVFFMTPGLAFFYGGLVRRKNVCNTMMACVAIMGLSVLLWTMFGYSLSFGGNHAGIIGDFRWAFLNDVGWEAGSVCGYHSASCICCIPDDVCHDYSGTDHRCCSRKDEI